MGKHHAKEYHMGLPDVLTVVRRMEERGCIRPDTVKVINHFSHNGKMTHEELERFAAEHGLTAAYDGMNVRV